ncbi:hypothetical protein ACFPM0_15065 [Pseudonocardia sulfidoxydans]|uniref:hypothetical protein n=1 Tax=Pseudonocardia sulfidoxydans TaxID=54011 RepID=UPI0036179ED9
MVPGGCRARPGRCRARGRIGTDENAAGRRLETRPAPPEPDRGHLRERATNPAACCQHRRS